MTVLRLGFGVVYALMGAFGVAALLSLPQAETDVDRYLAVFAGVHRLLRPGRGPSADHGDDRAPPVLPEVPRAARHRVIPPAQSEVSPARRTATARRGDAAGGRWLG